MKNTMTKKPSLFKKCSIPYQPPNQTCNARLWLNGQETYCQESGEGGRCIEHDVNRKRKAKLEREANLKFVEAHKLWNGAMELFKDHLGETTLYQAVISDFGKLLDELVEATPLGVIRLLAKQRVDTESQRLNSEIPQQPQGAHTDG